MVALDSRIPKQPRSLRAWWSDVPSRRSSYVLTGVCYLALYAALDRLSLVHGFHGLGISLWNPSIGLSLALLLTRGLSFAPFLFLAIFCTDAWIHSVSRSLFSIAVTAAIVTLSYSGVAWLFRSQFAFDIKRARLKDIITLLVGLPACAVLISFFYCGSLYLMGYLPAPLFWGAVEHLWIGDTIGAVIVVPAVMAAFVAIRERATPQRVRSAGFDLAIFLLGLTLALWLIFGPAKANEFQYFYLLFVPVIWIAIREGFTGAIVGIVILHVALVVVTKVEGYQAADFLAFQKLMLTLVATGLLLGAMVTERRETEERLRAQRAQISRMSRYATASAMGFSLAHQISQPLSTVATYLHAARRLFRSNRLDAPAVSDALDKAEAEARRARQVLERVKDFLSYGRIEPVHLDLLALAGKIVRVLGAEAWAQGVRIEVDGHGRLEVEADEIQIEQVLLNLIGNAVDAAAERNDRRGKVRIHLSRRDGIVSVSVDDNGPGVAPEIAGNLFQPFETTKPRGMGLGLPLCRQIIESHGGHLTWKRLEPCGSSFTFELHVDGPDSHDA